MNPINKSRKGIKKVMYEKLIGIENNFDIIKISPRYKTEPKNKVNN